MKTGKYPVKRSDTKAVKLLKRKLNAVEKSILSCSLRGFNSSKLANARSYYIEQIKKAQITKKRALAPFDLNVILRTR